MRKLTNLKTLVVLTVCAAFAMPDLYAQTTFETSNNPSASIHVERIDQDATLVTITQKRGNASYVELSQNTVIKDQQTGIAYNLVMLDCNIDPHTDIETHHLTFRPFLDGTGDFDLLEPCNQNASLFFSKIQVAEASPAIALGTN
ncbi:MAG: hypothetical protein AB8F78_05445 [Saprospiraceae bacterium]